MVTATTELDDDKYVPLLMLMLMLVAMVVGMVVVMVVVSMDRDR